MENFRSRPMFYLDSDLNPGENKHIPGAESGHILQSRRLRCGDQLLLTNGQGVRATAAVLSIRKKRDGLTVRIESSVLEERPVVRKTLAAAIPKGERQSVLLGMATQLGMSAYIPLICEYSVVKYQQKMKDRWRRIVTGACKQCRQCHFPVIEDARSIRSVLDSSPPDTLIVIGDLEGKSMETANAEITPGIREVRMLVGPEGGFSETERQLMSRRNALKLRLSNQVLRTETAAVSLLAAVNQLKLIQEY